MSLLFSRQRPASPDLAPASQSQVRRPAGERVLGARSLEATARSLAERWTATESFPVLSESDSRFGSLAPAIRTFAEDKLGIDLSSVRVHADEPAARLSRAQGASAFTRGDDIYFAAGTYAPDSRTGRQLLAHELVHVAQQRLEYSGELAWIQKDAAPTTPKELRDKYVTFFLPDYGGMAAELLARLPAESRFVNEVFDLLAERERTVVSTSIASKATDEQLATIAADAAGRAVLWRVMGAARELSSMPIFEKDLERVLFAVSPEHKRLKQEPWTEKPEVAAAAKTSGTEIQSISSGWASGLPQFDEYSVTIDAMPAGLTPEQFLAEMANDLNKAVSDYWFDAINEFKRTKTEKPPAVGDVYHIDIKGPDNGSVMLVESTPDHFVFQTVATAQDGTHPEYGSREFGFERSADGSIRFFTRGASRSSMVPGTTLAGRPLQKVGWTHLVTGIGNELARRGGKVRAGSIQSWRTQD
jgi:hypothetical protein